jgi:hypothetical protein
MAAHKQFVDGETRDDLLFIRLTPTEKARVKALTKEMGQMSMSATMRYLLNTYYEISHRKAS